MRFYGGVRRPGGVATIALVETFMVKSHEPLGDSATRVDVNTGIVAASRSRPSSGPRTTASISPRWRPGFHVAGPDLHEQRARRVFADRTCMAGLSPITVSGNGQFGFHR